MDIRRLGMGEEQRTVFEHILKAPHGMVLVTGPTGSGKTTTPVSYTHLDVYKRQGLWCPSPETLSPEERGDPGSENYTG